jgi:hypothetical protein
MWWPEGFQRKIPARECEWKTTGTANIFRPKSLHEDSDMADDRSDILLMITLRSSDQFNTTIYGYDDRFRRIRGTRSVVLMNIQDVARLGSAESQEVTLATVSDDGVDRSGPGCLNSFPRFISGLRKCTMVTETASLRVTYAQNWPAYNAAAMS